MPNNLDQKLTKNCYLKTNKDLLLFLNNHNLNNKISLGQILLIALSSL